MFAATRSSFRSIAVTVFLSTVFILSQSGIGLAAADQSILAQCKKMTGHVKKACEDYAEAKGAYDESLAQARSGVVVADLNQIAADYRNAYAAYVQAVQNQ